MDNSKILTCFLLLIFSNISYCQFQCPEQSQTKTFYGDSQQCDLYYVCQDGVAKEKLCKDGLVFRDDNHKKELCDLPVNVPCGDRTLLQEPQPSKGCPRANGYFKHEDPLMCDRFVNCIDSVASVMSCPPGLIYDEKISSCIWAVDSEMSCHSKRVQLDDGFICPDEGPVSGPGGHTLPHPTYPHSDCDKFYICRNGVEPQKGQCNPGTVYDELTFRCNEPEHVPGCEEFYKEKN